MPTPTGTISGVSYAKITSVTAGEYWIINPYDLSGNLFSEITIEVDTTQGDVTLGLPYLEPYNPFLDPLYSTNGGTNITIKIVKITGDPQQVLIITAGNTVFSGSTNPTLIYLDNIGNSLSVTPIGTNPFYEILLNWKIQ
jgi:hypothetical protein